MHQGQVPLQTLRADLDYGFSEAVTTMGRIGIKVWINKGEVLPEAKAETTQAATQTEETAELPEAIVKKEKPAKTIDKGSSAEKEEGSVTAKES